MGEMTEKSLKEAFAGESQARNKYLAFAKQAKKENLPGVARLFKAIAYAEWIHAERHLKVMDGVGDTSANLEEAAEGENYESNEMYAAFKAIADLQDEKQAFRAFHLALEAEKVHEDLYRQTKEKVDEGEDLTAEQIRVCPVCGYTDVDGDVDPCPICNTPAKKFKSF